MIVPVLSKITRFTLCIFCKLSAFFISIQYSAHLPTHTIIAVGVASHKAQGQAMTKTLTKATIPVTKLPVIIRTMSDITARAKTIGTNIDEIWSASF